MVLSSMLVVLPLFCGAETKPMPALNAQTLSGNTVRLPGTTDGKPVVLVFGFAQSAREQSEAWGKNLIALEQERSDFSFFQVAMLAGAPRFTHGLIARAIRASVPSAYHPHMLLVTANGKEWRDLLDVTDNGSAYVVLCGPMGEIRWKTRGAGQAQLDALRTQLQNDAY